MTFGDSLTPAPSRSNFPLIPAISHHGNIVVVTMLMLSLSSKHLSVITLKSDNLHLKCRRTYFWNIFLGV